MVENIRVPPIGARAFTTAALCSLSALAMLCMFDFSAQPNFLLDRQAEIRAVGDAGCLGRSCKMSDVDAAKDLNNFFQSFLDKGPHAGRKTAHIRNLEHNRAKTIKLSDSDAKEDLDHYYESLPSSKTDRVQNAEAKSEFLPLLADSESRKDLDNYYDHLKTGPGRKAKILEAEMNAKREALHLHLDGVARLKAEEKHMLEIEASSVIQARKDKTKYAKTEQVEQDVQDEGHKMEAVPSARQSTTESRKDAGTYFDSLQKNVHKTQTVLRAESSAEAQAHTDMSLASHPQSIDEEPAARSKAGWLSEKEDKKKQEQFFNSLQEKVRKTPAVLQAEAQAEAQAKHDLQKAAESSQVSGASSGNIKHALSKEEADEDQEHYFEALNAQVHKTARVLKAEALAHSLAMKHKAAVSIADSVAAREAARAAPAVGDSRLSAKLARQQLAQAIDAFPVNKRPHPKVMPAVGDERLSADKAREKLEKAIDSFPVHKTAAVLRAEAVAEAGAAADLAKSSTESVFRENDGHAGPTRLSAAAAAAEQHKYFDSLQAQVHKTAKVLRAEARAKAAAAAAHKRAAVSMQKPLSAGPSKSGPHRLSAKQAQAEQDRYFRALSGQVGKTQSVLRAEKLAEIAAARDARAAAAVEDPHPVAPAVATGGRLSAAEARRDLDQAVDALPTRTKALPHVNPAVGDARLSAAEARKELNRAVDAFPVHKTATVLRAEAAARADSARHAREGAEVVLPRSSVAEAQPQRLSAREAREELDRAVDALPVHKVSPPAVKPAVGDARMTAAEARAEMRQAIDSLPVHKTPLVLHAEAAAKLDKAEQARFRAAEVRAGERVPVAAVPSGQLSTRQSRAALDKAIDSLPHHQVALPQVKPAVGDARLTAAESRSLLARDIDALPVGKTASVLRSEAAAAAATTTLRSARAVQSAQDAAPVVLDRRLSSEEASKEMDAAIDALPHAKKALPHVQPAVGDTKLTAEEARTELDAAVDALPHEKAPLRHVKAAVSGARISTAEARKEMDAAMDALPHAKGPLPHGEAAVPAVRLAATAARRDLDSYFDALPLPHHALPKVAPAVGDARLPAAAARRALVQDLARLKHS
jgi:hypothetical protein